MKDLPKSIYIHIPFCDHICIYCDFYKMIASCDKQDIYIDYLIKEIDLKKSMIDYHLDTLYIGGGTPSSLSFNNLNKLLTKLNEVIDLKNLKEFTIECNPIDLNNDLIDLFKSFYVNRISLVVQSFNNDKLKFLHRNHSRDIAIKAIRLLKEKGFTNISCDLIYGLNNDTIDLIKNDLDIIINENIPHISCYTLIIEDKTILNHFIVLGYILLEDDKEAEIFAFVNDYLQKFGYNHYEVSNYAINGYESIHNLAYWSLDQYLAFGPSGSSFINHKHITNINNLNKYYEGIDKGVLNYSEDNLLNINEEMDEYVMVGLRKVNTGINKNLFKKRFGYDIIDVYGSIISLVNNGLLIDDGENIKISEDKIYVMNSILLKIFN